MSISVYCGGKKISSIKIMRPCWDDVYRLYKKCAIENTRYQSKSLSFLDGQSRSLSMSGAALVSYALNNAPIWENRLSLNSPIGDANKLKNWLSEKNVWGNADIEVNAGGQNGIVSVKNKIGRKNGIYIILGGAAGGHATLWLSRSGNVIDGNNYIDKGGTVYFWELKGFCPIKSAAFSKEKFDKYKKYIINNASKGLFNRDDCIVTVQRSTRILLDDEKIPAEGNMDVQMAAMRDNDYAGNRIEIDFKDSNGKLTSGVNNPAGFFGISLSEAVIELLGSDAGYHFFGISIMDGYHSAMAVVNNTDPNNPSFNVYDQIRTGSVLGDPNRWYSSAEMDAWLLRYVEKGHPLESGGKGITTTTVTPIKHKRKDYDE